KKRPGAEMEMRWPLCVIGRAPKFPEPKPSLAMTLSSEQLEADEDDGLAASDADVDVEAVHDNEELTQRPRPKRVKHLSDPIIKPPPIYLSSPLAGDLFVPKRRDSWQFHYIFPSQPGDVRL